MNSLRFVKNLIACAVLSVLFVSVASADVDPPLPLQPEAGYIELDSIKYSLSKSNKKTRDYHTAQHDIFYSFFPADKDAADKPLFVFLNGGPGAATTTNLFSMNTAPFTLDRDIVCKEQTSKDCLNGYAENKYSWTAVGNLLYIDAPGTGFSYLVTKNDNPRTRHNHFYLDGDFNPFIDADQVVRVILRFLAKHTDIIANEVILVAESYGGTRVSTMLNLLLFNQRYGEKGAAVFRDQAMVDEIVDHFKAVAEHGKKGKSQEETPTQAAKANLDDSPSPVLELTPERVAEQFGKQILIQPSLSGKYQDEVQGEMFYDRSPYSDKVIKNLASEVGQEFPNKKYWWSTTGRIYCHWPLASPANCVLMYFVPMQFKRDIYNDTKPADWSDRLDAFAVRSLNNYTVLKTVLKYDPADIVKMRPAARKNAFKSVIKYSIKRHTPLSVSQDSADAEKTQNEAMPPQMDSPELAKFKKEDEQKVKEDLDNAFGKNMADMILNAKVPLSPRFWSMNQEEQELATLEPGIAALRSPTLKKTFGSLNGCDTYMDSFNKQIYLAFTASAPVKDYDLNADQSPRYGDMFLENVQLVKTFLTDAQKDLVIYSPAIAKALEKHDNVVTSVTYDKGDDKKPGNFSIHYKKNAYKDILAKSKDKVDLYYPLYPDSGHSVSTAQPDKLLQDVKQWLSQK